MMKTYHEETLSALFDGEVTDPDALADALAQPGAVQFLVELSRLRTLTQDDDRRPDTEFYAEMRRALRPSRWRVFLRAPLLPLPAAAAVALGAVAVTLWVPSFGPAVSLQAPPPPALPTVGVVRSVPSPVPERPPAPKPVIQPEPPVAHRTMRFVEGRDWRQGL